MFCIDFGNKKRIREIEKEYLDKVLSRLNKKSYLKPDNFFRSIFRKKCSRKFIFKPEELIKEELEILNFISISCIDIHFNERFDRDNPESDRRLVKCVGIPSSPLVPVNSWNKEYYKLGQDKQKDLLFLHEVHEIKVEFIISDDSYFWYQESIYDDIAPQESGYFLSVGLSESEFNKVWSLRTSSNTFILANFGLPVYKEPTDEWRSERRVRYVDFKGILGDIESCGTQNNHINIEPREISITNFQQKKSYDERLSNLFKERQLYRC